VIDTFIYPTKEFGLVLRNAVEEHNSLGYARLPRPVAV
jgi:hypothetical protein